MENNTPVEIEGGNDLISAFMGLREEDGPEVITNHHVWHTEPVGVGGCVTASLQYHSSWDWLMPVVRKIKDYLNNMDRPSKHHCCNGDLIEVDIQCHLWSIDIVGVHKSCIEFIKWHNDQNPISNK